VFEEAPGFRLDLREISCKEQHVCPAFFSLIPPAGCFEHFLPGPWCGASRATGCAQRWRRRRARRSCISQARPPSQMCPDHPFLDCLLMVYGCTSVPVHTRRSLLPGLATRSRDVCSQRSGVSYTHGGRGEGLVPHHTRGSVSLSLPLLPVHPRRILHSSSLALHSFPDCLLMLNQCSSAPVHWARVRSAARRWRHTCGRWGCRT